MEHGGDGLSELNFGHGRFDAGFSAKSQLT
jgi:hypothetical protein